MVKKVTRVNTRIVFTLAIAIMVSAGLLTVRFFDTPVDSVTEPIVDTLPIEGQNDCDEGSGLCEIIDPETLDDLGEKRIFVYYFHYTERIPNCRAVQSLAKEAVEMNLAEEISLGEVTFAAFNLDEPENLHFIARYDIVDPSLIVSKMKGDEEVEYVNLDSIWDLVGSPEEYSEYITQEIASLLGESD